jgi:hypothetical protein
MITILVGDVTTSLCDTAKKLDPTASLITEDNCTSIQDGVYYTSLGDFKFLKDFVVTLGKANRLIYSPPDQWTDTNSDNVSYMKKWTEFYLQAFSGFIKVEGIDQPLDDTCVIDSMLSLKDARKVKSQQLWVAGCSVSNGDWIDPADRYGQLLSNKLKIPVSFLTHGGSSIKWAADQILRSDIQKDDIVIFGLTSTCRFNYYQNKKVLHINHSYYKSYPDFNTLINIDTLDSENSIYQSLISVHQVVNFCRIIGAKLVLAGLLVVEEELPYFVSIPEYYHLRGFFGLNQDNLFMDFADDNIHPGPKMHKWYADQIFKLLN